MLRYIVIFFILLTLVKSQFDEINFLDAPGEIVVPVSIFDSFAETSLNDVTFLGNGTSPLVNSSNFDIVLSIIAPLDGYIKFPKELVNDFTTFEAINREGDSTTDCRITKRRSEGRLIKRDTINTTCTFITIGATSTSELDTAFTSVVIGFPARAIPVFDDFRLEIPVERGFVNFTVVGRDIFDNDIQLTQTIQLFSTMVIYQAVILFCCCCCVFLPCIIDACKACQECYDDFYYDYCYDYDYLSCWPCYGRNRYVNNPYESGSVASSLSRAPQEEEVPVNALDYMNINRPYGISLPQAELASECGESVIDVAEAVSRVSNSVRHSQIPMAERYQGYSTTL